MKKKTFILLAVGLVLVAGGVFYLKKGKKTTAVSFVTIKPAYGYIARSVTATGTVQPVDTVSVGAQVSGVVKSVYVDFNSVVIKGQLLATVDPSIINAQTDQSRANLSNAQSNVEYQRSNFERQDQLYKLGAISKADYQVALNQYNMARSSVSGAAAQLKLVERNLYYTKIYSPINGVVLNRNVSEGQTIASSFNAPTLFVIARDLTKMQVRAAVDEADIGEVKPGQQVSFTVDAFPDDIFEGEVRQVLLHPSVSANVVTYATLINVENSDLKLKPGMTASITIYLEEDTNALLIPARALNFKPDSARLKSFVIQKAERKNKEASKNRNGNNHPFPDSVKQADVVNGQPAFVWVKRGDSLVEKRILTGLTDDVSVKVIKGLSPNEEIISGINAGGAPTTASTTTQSPFMPQMRRRQTSSNPH